MLSSVLLLAEPELFQTIGSRGRISRQRNQLRRRARLLFPSPGLDHKRVQPGVERDQIDAPDEAARAETFAAASTAATSAPGLAEGRDRYGSRPEIGRASCRER